MSFENKKVLVIGATGGIGLSIVEGFLNNGAFLAASGSRAEIDIQNSNLVYIQTDLSEEKSAESLVTQAINHLESIDVLVCNFGIKADNLFMRMSLIDWKRVIDLNLTKTFEINKLVLSHMLSKRLEGRIINVSSIIGSIGNPGQSNYCASKAGMEAMTKCLACEVAKRKITVNCVAPGFIDVGMTSSLSEEIKSEYIKRIPAGRFGTGDDVFKAIQFLAGKNSSYITGQTIHVNGGMYMP